MAIDVKYGRVALEHGSVGEDEVVVVFRGGDTLLLRVLGVYSDYCFLAGSASEHLDAVDDAARAVAAWQAEHGARVPGARP